MAINISDIRIDGGTQSRACINDATVTEYAEAMADPSTVFPPIIAYFDGSEYWLADGFHRLAAWKRLGRTDIPADVRQGDCRKAILHSVAANSAHGLRRTNEDKRRAVLTLLEDEEWSRWSANQIAKQCGVSHTFVNAIKSSLETASSEPRAYTTKHGTQATMQTANIGASAKVESPTSSQPTLAETHVDAEVDSAASGPVEPAPTAPDQLPEPEEETDPEVAKVKRELARLTEEGVAGTVIELRAALAETKGEKAKLKAEVARLKELVKQFDGDKDQNIKNLAKTIEHKSSEMYRANERLQAELRRNFALNKRIEELEKMGVVTL